MWNRSAVASLAWLTMLVFVAGCSERPSEPELARSPQFAKPDNPGNGNGGGGGDDDGGSSSNIPLCVTLRDATSDAVASDGVFADCDGDGIDDVHYVHGVDEVVAYIAQSDDPNLHGMLAFDAASSKSGTRTVHVEIADLFSGNVDAIITAKPQVDGMFLGLTENDPTPSTLKVIWSADGFDYTLRYGKTCDNQLLSTTLATATLVSAGPPRVWTVEGSAATLCKDKSKGKPEPTQSFDVNAPTKLTLQEKPYS